MNNELKILKNKMVTIVMVAFFALFFILCQIKPQDAFSNSERRALAQRPPFTAESVESGAFMEAFEEYALDQFPFRERFRQGKAMFSTYLLRQQDLHEIYQEDGYLSQMEYPLDKKSVLYAASRFSHIYQRYLEETGVNVYVSVIPDKNYFMAEESGHLSMNYQELEDTLLEAMDYATYIDIMDLLSLEDYYKTDTHWRQECIVDVAERLSLEMGTASTENYQEKILPHPFYGVYYGQAGLPFAAEEIKYLTSKELEGCKVFDFENNREIGMYDFEKGAGKDPYEFFLSGSRSFLTIENEHAMTDKELILFRDSFSSSLAPLLATGYQKITLVDIRYLHPDMLGRLLTFDNQDVLFLYSTLVLNNAETIK